jgi:hypothetical protein
VFATQKVSWSKKNVNAFLNGVLAKTEKLSALKALPQVCFASLVYA